MMTANPHQLTPQQVLAQPSFFKLICGASFTDLPTIAPLVEAYLPAGIACIDIAPHPDVLACVITAFEAYQAKNATAVLPTLMVSLDLDGDPHFRKVAVKPDACIACGLCLPECPTEALALDATLPEQLAVDLPKCYGCGRCVPVCPTDAFAWVPQTQLPEPLQAILSNPWVNAVELHTHALDVDSLRKCFEDCATVFAGKLISLCFRPSQTASEQAWIGYLQVFEGLVAGVNGFPLLQIDGKPMSGSEEAFSSKPAIEGALQVLRQYQPAYPVTLSGGVNLNTPALVKTLVGSGFQRLGIWGVGVGTIARKKVAGLQGEVAIAGAKAFVKAFFS
ncbi:MAG: 4Fe-4S dicluster domain-containing protein [Candidatus Melainabacteria bacterium]|nr:4Fe-4S dicluster domain-containing protein [Candidatus Melainabacteria bacterium]